ncbi:endonuclease NucS [Corynebacterium mendelii]|uniref:Endonuclease NucS n=1 Tax=Corynebacterium mendelii TaxID=2765362 RepID=A0A939E1Y0_9CORY|nr:endonuclease NucS [Corynebacterium mendelii]MBN9644955.1 endonuclease NucS [Corynebacterium mendelii]
MRLVLARCSVNYDGRLTAHLPMADRLVMIKADGSVSIHADDRAYKPLNWMTPPCTIAETITETAGAANGNDATAGENSQSGQSDAVSPEAVDSTVMDTRSIDSDSISSDNPLVWVVSNSKKETLTITIEEIYSDISRPLGEDPGLEKDGVEAHLQELLAKQIDTLGKGWRLIRREYPTPIGPVDILCRDADGTTVAVEIKRRGEIDGVEQLSRYLELLNRDSAIAPVEGIFAAQQIKPQARVLAEDRGIRCVVLNYDELRGKKTDDLVLF